MTVRALLREAIHHVGPAKDVVEAIAKASLGKAVYGAAAVNHVSKLLRTNAISGAVALDELACLAFRCSLTEDEAVEVVHRLEHDVDDDWLREYEGAEHRREFLRPKLEACVEEAVHERPEEVRCRTAERETADLAAEYLLDETELGVASDALRGIVQTLTARPQGRVSAAEGLAPRIRKQLEGRVFQIVKKRPKIGPLPTLGQARRLLNLPPPGADAPPAAPSP